MNRPLPDRRAFLSSLALLAAGCASPRVTRTAPSAVPPPPEPAGPPRPASPPLSAYPAALARVVAVTRGLAVAPGRWQMIVGHHAGVPTGNAAIYDRYHRANGMENGLAYHFVIGNGTKSGDGEIEIGDRWLRQLHGGHVRSAPVNQFGIGICCVGNYELAAPTPAQLASFAALVDYLRGEVAAPTVRFAVHREIDGARTVCPGRHFPVAALHARYG